MKGKNTVWLRLLLPMLIVGSLLILAKACGSADQEIDASIEFAGASANQAEYEER